MTTFSVFSFRLVYLFGNVWRIGMMCILALGVFSACSNQSEDLPNRPTLVTTLPVLRLIIEPIALEYDIEVLLPDGQSPHGFQVSPSQAKKLSSAHMLIYAHPEIDGWAAQLSLESSFPLWESRATEDAHFWTDPVAVSTAAIRFADELCSIQPEQCAVYRRRAVSFSVRIDSVSNVIDQNLAEIRSDCFIEAHSFMTQFLNRFEIRAVGPIQPLPGHDASPRTLTAMMNEAKSAHCRTLLVQKAVDNRAMNALASDLGVNVVVVDPLGSEQQTYEAYLMALLDALKAPSHN